MAVKVGVAFTWATGSPTTSGTTNPIDTSSDDVQTVFASVVVTGTPTTGCQFTVQESPDGGGTPTWFNTTVMTAPTVAGTYAWPISTDPTTKMIQVSQVAQSGGGTSTLTLVLGQMTSP
jgi:hypothetical protein